MFSTNSLYTEWFWNGMIRIYIADVYIMSLISRKKYGILKQVNQTICQVKLEIYHCLILKIVASLFTPYCDLFSRICYINWT